MQINSKHSGFTLIELMIVLVIVSILATIAYPSYQDAVRKSRRGEAKDVLVLMQLNQEKFRANGITYANTAAYEAAYSTMASLNTPHYTYSIPAAGLNNYTVQAVAAGDQANDKDGAQTCATLSINQAGTTVPTKAQGCW